MFHYGGGIIVITWVQGGAEDECNNSDIIWLLLVYVPMCRVHKFTNSKLFDRNSLITQGLCGDWTW